MQDIEIIVPKPDIPTNVQKYVPQYGEDKVIKKHIDAGIPLCAIGPKGTGKTLSFASVAQEEKVPLIQFDCSESTKRGDLIGRFVLIGSEVKFQLGALPTALATAQSEGACILVLEELTALPPQQQKMLNQILDWRKHVYIPEIGKTFHSNGGKLLVAATTNPSTYAAVFELNEDLKSRLSILRYNYPKESVEMEIIKASVSPVIEEEAKNLITLARESREAVKEGRVDYALSPRDVCLTLQARNAYNNLKGAIKTTILNKYESQAEIDFMSQRIHSIFP